MGQPKRTSRGFPVGQVEPLGILFKFEFPKILGTHLLKATGGNLAPAELLGRKISALS